MGRKPSITNTLYHAARVSNNIRAASRGPTAYGKRVVRRHVYRHVGRATRGVLKALGMSK